MDVILVARGAAEWPSPADPGVTGTSHPGPPDPEAVAAARRVAPAPAVVPRGVDEQQPTGRIGATPGACVILEERDERDEEVARESSPARLHALDPPVR